MIIALLSSVFLQINIDLKVEQVNILCSITKEEHKILTCEINNPTTKFKIRYWCNKTPAWGLEVWDNNIRILGIGTDNQLPPPKLILRDVSHFFNCMDIEYPLHIFCIQYFDKNQNGQVDLDDFTRRYIQ